MRKIKRRETYILPTWAEYYFATGETTDMSEDEIQEAEKFLARNNLRGKNFNAVVEIDLRDPSFRWTNDMNNIGGDVVETTFTIFED